MYELIGCLFFLCVVVMCTSLIRSRNKWRSIIEKNNLLVKEVNVLIKKFKKEQNYTGEE